MSPSLEKTDPHNLKTVFTFRFSLVFNKVTQTGHYVFGKVCMCILQVSDPVLVVFKYISVQLKILLLIPEARTKSSKPGTFLLPNLSSK